MLQQVHKELACFLNRPIQRPNKAKHERSIVTQNNIWRAYSFDFGRGLFDACLQSPLF